MTPREYPPPPPLPEPVEIPEPLPVPDPVEIPGLRLCSIDGCEKTAKARGWCAMHYRRWQIHGDVHHGFDSPEERFWAKVDRSGGSDACWPWTGCLTSWGYGHTRWGPGGRNAALVMAHRVAWELTNGPIPEGLLGLHHCDNPPCCNPAHLFLGTMADNVRDMVRKERHSGRLTAEQARAIYLAPGLYADIAAEFGVSPNHVSQIKSRTKWRMATEALAEQEDDEAWQRDEEMLRDLRQLQGAFHVPE